MSNCLNAGRHYSISGKIFLKISPWIFLIFSFLCSGCREGKVGSIRTVPPQAVIPFNLEGQRLHDVARLKKIVRLENHPDALLGWVDRVVARQEGDLFILDQRSTQRLYRFSGDGSFLNTVGNNGEGPGEYRRIEDFWITENGICHVLESNKLHKFDQNSAHIGDENLSFVTRQGDALGNHFVVSRLWSREQDSPMYALFDEQLHLTAEFGRRDPILAKFPLVPQRHIATSGTHIFTAEFFQSEINSFDHQGQLRNRFVFPNAGQDILDRLRAPTPSPEDERYVLGHIRSIYQIWACNRFLYINENLADLGTRRSSIFFPVQGACYYFDNDALSTEDGSVELNHIQGIAGEALIQVVFEERTLRRLESNYPELAEVHLKPNDNPIILLLDLSGWPKK